LSIVKNIEIVTAPVTFTEMLDDHFTLVEGYLDTHITRNHSDRTLEWERIFLQNWFEGILVPDHNHPSGERQLFVWEAMTPVLGRQRIQEFSKGLAIAEFSPRTVNKYLGTLRRLFDIEQPVSKYDYPVQAINCTSFTTLSEPPTLKGIRKHIQPHAITR